MQIYINIFEISIHIISDKTTLNKFSFRMTFINALIILEG